MQMNQRWTNRLLTPLAIHHFAGNNMINSASRPRHSTEGILRPFTQAILVRHLLHVFRRLGQQWFTQNFQAIQEKTSGAEPTKKIVG